MRFIRQTWQRWLIGGLLLASVSGCVIVSDLFNSDTFPFPQPSQGVVIVAFNNTTSLNATFFAYESADASNPELDSRNFSAVVMGGEVANEVLDCPVEAVSPGALGADFTRSTVAAIVQDATGLVTVNYNGPVLESPSFQCGDVVEIRLSRSTVGEQVQYLISVRVIPG